MSRLLTLLVLVAVAAPLASSAIIHGPSDVLIYLHDESNVEVKIIGEIIKQNDPEAKFGPLSETATTNLKQIYFVGHTNENFFKIFDRILYSRITVTDDKSKLYKLEESKLRGTFSNLWKTITDDIVAFNKKLDQGKTNNQIKQTLIKKGLNPDTPIDVSTYDPMVHNKAKNNDLKLFIEAIRAMPKVHLYSCQGTNLLTDYQKRFVPVHTRHILNPYQKEGTIGFIFSEKQPTNEDKFGGFVTSLGVKGIDRLSEVTDAFVSYLKQNNIKSAVIKGLVQPGSNDAIPLV